MRFSRIKRGVVLALTGIMFMSACTPMTAFAIGGQYDPTFFSNNNIFIYNPTDTGCPSQTLGQLSGNDNRQKIYSYWVTQGLKPNQAAGITGAMQTESGDPTQPTTGFSPFYQQAGQTWPSGGYGIADFRDGQRTAVTNFIESNSNSLSPGVYTQYYSSDFGGATTQSTGYVPAGIPTTSPDVNDLFLGNELNYLAQTYLPGFVPNPTSTDGRVAALTTDQNLTIPSGTKLLDYIKTLTTPEQVADAWVYLYDYPTTDSATLQKDASTAGTDAEQVLAAYDSSDNSGSNCSNVGVGGLTYAQAETFMKFYSVYTNREPYIPAGFRSSATGKPYPKDNIESYQCVTFVAYFSNRFVTADSGHGNGIDVANDLVKYYSGYWKSVTQANVQPFTVYSFAGGEDNDGHTGVILGVESDGSVVIGEANIGIGDPSGLVEKPAIYGSKSNTPNGVSAAEHWKSLAAYVAYMKSIGYTPSGFATPINETSVTSKIQASLGSS